MAGAISGGFHGIKAIPRRWLEDLDNLDKGRDFVLELGQKLWDRKGLGP
jgi:ADP-ribosylglycohydrolase